jgi:hypothetical protein
MIDLGSGGGILAFLAAHLFSAAWLCFSRVASFSYVVLLKFVNLNFSRDAAFCSSVIIPSVLSFNFY